MSSKNVQVFVRTRPSNSFASDNIIISDDLKSIDIFIPKDAEKGHINNQAEQWKFDFQKVLHNASQEQVFDETTAALVDGCFAGFNGTLMAYGQTGAGKTFTISGSSENYKHRGMIPRAISQVFKYMESHPENAYTIRMSYLEIYNEQLLDLLNGPNPSKTPLLIYEEDNICHVKGLQIKLVASEEEAISLLFEGETNRSIAEHQMNRASSRSHCIFTVYIESKSRDDPDNVIEAKLNFVDLAGSERVSKTKTEGAQLREAMYINKSLSILEQVIINLNDKTREHIPYRRSKLTTLLKDALGGNCNTLFIANIWGEKSHVPETISTLRFASRMMCITNCPIVNVPKDQASVLKKYERIIQELKQELVIKDRMLSQKNIQYEPFSQVEKEMLLHQIKAYTSREIEEIEITSIRFAKELTVQFRNYCISLEKEYSTLKSRKMHMLSPGQDGMKAEEALAESANVIKPNISQPEPTATNATAPNPTVNAKAAGQAPPVNDPKDKNAAGKDKEKDVATKQAIPKTGVNAILANVPVDSQLAALLSGSVTSGANTAPTVAQGGNTTANNAPADSKKEAAVNAAAITASNAVANTASLNRPASGGATNLSAQGLNGSQATFIPLAAESSVKAKVLISKDEAYEEFKQGKGAEMEKVLRENKSMLQEKKTNAREIADKINELKTEIDEIKSTLTSRNVADLGPDEDNDIFQQEEHELDEEEQDKIQNIQELKQQYKEQFNLLRQYKLDIEFCDKLVHQCRQKILNEFENWYMEEYLKDNTNKGPKDTGPNAASSVFFKAKIKTAKQTKLII